MTGSITTGLCTFFRLEQIALIELESYTIPMFTTSTAKSDKMASICFRIIPADTGSDAKNLDEF
jgi:hypothetical protein